MKEEEVFRIGEIVRVHGVKGKLEIAYTDDVFMRADIDYLFFRMDGLLVPFFVESYSSKGRNRALLKLEDIETEEAAQRFLEAEVFFPLDEVPEREEIPDSWDFLTGYKVSDVSAGLIGDIVAVNAQSTNVILFVEKEDGSEVMLPMHPDLVVGMDEKNRHITMELPEGILTIND